MKFINKVYTIISLLVAFGFYQAAAPQLQAQVSYKITADDIPSGGGSNQNSDSGDDAIYIVAGLAVAAVIGYALYKKFNKSDEEDSTTANEASINQLMRTEKNSFASKLQEFREKMPVDLYFGVKNHSATIPDRTYSVGIAYRF